MMGVAWWEGQSSRGQECTFSSFARSPLEYKFATLSPWRETLSLSPPPAIPVGLYATSSTPETSSNNLQPLRMDFEFLDTPLPSIHRRIARQLDYQFIHSRWKNDRCNAFYRTRRWKPAVKTWSRFRFQRFAPTNLSRRIFIRISPVSVLRMYVCTWLFLDIGDTCESRHFPGSNAKIIVVGSTENRDARIRYDSGYNNKRMTVLSRAFLFPFNKRRPTFRRRNISNLAKFVSIPSIDRSRRRSSRSNKTNRHCSLFPPPLFSFLYTRTPNSFEGLNGDNRRRGVFARDARTHFSLQLPPPLPVTPITDPKSLRNEWEKSRGWLADKRRVEIGNKERSILGDGCRRGRDKTDRLHWSTVYRTRGIAQIHPLGSYRALIGSPNTILTSLDPAWKPQLTNGRSDLCRFPDTSSDDKLPDRAGILTQTSPWLPTGWLTTRQRTRPCRQTWPSTELSSLWRNAISPLEHRSDSGLTD